MSGSLVTDAGQTIVSGALPLALGLAALAGLVSFASPCVLPLVPGYNFYLAMLALVENRGAAAAQEGMVAVQIVAAIAIGAAVTSVIFRALAQRGKREANSPKDAA